MNLVKQFLPRINSAIPVLMGIYVFFNPFPHTTSIKEISFYLSVFLVIIAISTKQIPFRFKTPLAIPFILFTAWAFIGLFTALDLENSLHDFYAHLLRYIIFFYILINYFNSLNKIRILAWIIVVSTAIFSLYAINEFYILKGYGLNMRLGGYAGSMGGTNNTIIGVLVSFAIIINIHLLIHTKNKAIHNIVLLTALLVLSGTILLTQGRAFVFAIFAGIVLLLIKKWKTMLVVILLLAVIISFTPVGKRLGWNHIRFGEKVRFGIYYALVEIMKDYPVFGIGFGMQTYETHLDLDYYYGIIPDSMKYKKKNILNPHNILFDVGIRLGLLGLGLFLYVIAVFSKLCWQIIRHGSNEEIKNWGCCTAAGFASFFIIANLHPVLSHMPEMVFFLSFALITILYHFNQHTQELAQ